ncbi:MAG: arginine--tRNA ligase [Actinomycetota bacterium]|nr:arginine--tRNA ligase [Actinomycetota bacterium]
MVTEQLSDLMRSALDAAVRDGTLPQGTTQTIAFERPKRREHGDWSTNVALTAAKGSGDNPRSIAQALVERIPPSDLIESVEVAGPGFLNFRLSPAWLHDVVRRAQQPGFGRTTEGNGTRINVEYVSANPTGPINVVSGRHAAVGDSMANLLEACGHDVTREFYVNDAGRQMELFAASVLARYLQRFGVDAELPEEGYQGDYVADFARAIADKIGDRLVSLPDGDRRATIKDLALDETLVRMRTSLESFGTSFDVWFLESRLHASGEVDAAIVRLQDAELAYEKEGAIWFRSSRFGDDKDRVLVRSNGEPTYLAGDVAYVVDKFNRGFDRLIYLWGPDHHGSVARLFGAVEAQGLDRDSVRIVLSGHVTLTSAGQAVKSSKRAGDIVTLDELVDDVGADAARYTFQTRSLEAPLEFDLDAVKEQAPDNPVYYVQYAHARISSILRRAREEGLEPSATSPLDRVGEHPSEDSLMRKLASYEEVVPEAAHAYAPQKVTRFAEELAAVFTAFYRDCRVVTEDRELSLARAALCVATKAVLADALGLLGVGAPERM